MTSPAAEVSLLDVNVLLGLIDSDHVDHDRAHEWFFAGPAQAWATCPITENGFVRVMSQPRYASPTSPTRAGELLRQARGNGGHEFWACDVSTLDAVALGRVHGPAQVTDAYLLSLAVAHDGRLVTFDRRITVAAVPGASDRHLTLL